MTFESESQKLDQQAPILLVEVIHVNAGTFRFSSGSLDPNDSVAFGGDTYFARQMSISGLSAHGGKLPRPDIQIDNIDGFWWPLVLANKDLRGATVNIIEVYREGLDDGATPGADMIISDYTFIIRQKRSLDNREITFNLMSSMDRETAKFGRQCLRHVCARAYRVPDPGTADTFFAQPDCPYGDPAKRPGTGGDYFLKDGTVTANYLLDDCGQRLSDCKIRFGTVVDLPYQGMPSIGQAET